MNQKITNKLWSMVVSFNSLACLNEEMAKQINLTNDKNGCKISQNYIKTAQKHTNFGKLKIPVLPGTTIPFLILHQ